MSFARSSVIFFSLLFIANAADDPYAPLRLYNGTWEVTPANLAAGKSPDRLEDLCQQVGRFYACQQTVNGKVGALIVFIPTDKPGHYYTQPVTAEGWAVGRGELEINGSRWVYSGKSQDKDKTTYFRTVNVFTGNDRIHYEQSTSSDNEHWIVSGSGDEKRIGSSQPAK